MLIEKDGISREIDDTKLQEYKNKGYKVVDDMFQSSKPEKPAQKPTKK